MKQLGLSMEFAVQGYSDKDKHNGFLEDAEEGNGKLERWCVSELPLPFLWAGYLPVISPGVAVSWPRNNAEEKWPCGHFVQLELINVLDRVIS